MYKIKNRSTNLTHINQNKNKNKKDRNTFFAIACMVLSIAFAVTSVSAQDYYVSTSPANSIQQALDQALPGDTIHLSAGAYYQDFDTKKSGTANAPITITGPANAVIKGAGRGRVAQIFHDYYHLTGFTFDGLAGDPNSMNSYRDKLLYVQGTGNKEGVNGLKIENMTFKNSGGEALRLRYFAHDNEVAHSHFENIGVYDFKFNAGGKNGEAIYLGTSSNQWADGKNPTADPDESKNNWIHDNFFNTDGNEAVDIKEGAKLNIVENNIVTGQKDPDSGCLDSRGDENTFRYNDVHDCTGAGVRLGGHAVNGHQYGVNNNVYGNKISNNLNGGIKFQVIPQKDICGNEMSNNQGGNAVGTFGAQFNPTTPCSFPLTPNPVQNSTNATVNATVNLSDPNLSGNTSPVVIGDITVSASGSDGNLPQNTLDNNLNTRWSSLGDGQWILYDLGSSKAIDLLKIAFYKGNTRVQYFEILISEDNVNWQSVYSGQSSGASVALQTFDFSNTPGRYVKIIGHGNSLNSWNSLTEVKIQSQIALPPPSNGSNESAIAAVTASGSDGNLPQNTLDNNLNTRWSSLGDGQWILYDLGSSKPIDLLKIAFYKGNTRVQYFEILISEDNVNWQSVYSGQSSGASVALQTFDFSNTPGRYVKIIGHGNSLNSWNSLTEVKVNAN